MIGQRCMIATAYTTNNRSTETAVILYEQEERANSNTQQQYSAYTVCVCVMNKMTYIGG